MSNLSRQSYPLRLPEDIRRRVDASAQRKRWPLSTWLREAVIQMLEKESELEGAKAASDSKI